MNVLSPRAAAPDGGEAGFVARYRAGRERFADRASRDAAAELLSRVGLPRRTAEAWKYTDLRRLWERDRSAAAPADADRAAAMLAEAMGALGLDDTWPRLVFVDGALDESLSRPPECGIVAPFAGVAAAAPAGGGVPGEHPILALNTMLAEDGAVLAVPDGVDAGRLVLVTLCSGEGSHHLRHRVSLGVGASLTLLEVAGGRGAYASEGVCEIALAERAVLRHVRVQQDATESVSLSHVAVSVAQHGHYDGFNLALGGAVARHEVRAVLAGPYAMVHVNGAQLLGGSQIADLTSVIAHVAPHTSSRQTVKNVLTGRSRGVFQGKIVVERAAQKTDGYQMNQALLLSEEAEIDAKPELEIFADDVKCSHGATAGALDEEQLFYLRSRGVPLKEARTILIQAFLYDALALIEDEAVRDGLLRAMATWWGRRDR